MDVLTGRHKETANSEFYKGLELRTGLILQSNKSGLKLEFCKISFTGDHLFCSGIRRTRWYSSIDACYIDNDFFKPISLKYLYKINCKIIGLFFVK